MRARPDPGPRVQVARTQVKPRTGGPDDPRVRTLRDFLASMDRSSRLLLGGTVALSGASFAVVVNGFPGLAS
ncbi:MAG: hypothetical protein AVDCRST_MAG13-2751 [uncultured Solirubrobacteraceae bacterium]|uniref:Uncharacterized protein n=1 Tax=uncultured Solirubrobacteraceae bacterium TaxID=1162706 RepID=A0A6J4SZU9_9ACTN|nr:MAG: hypothetical protein AVDCRST_MAG13-2751 [uncultured Solirubrobacteraceae bacterium]